MPTVTRTFRVFVSSTFEDLKEERNALAAPGGPFEALQKLCQANGARFQAIDLRWGVREEAAHDQKTMEICLGEIERCQRTGIKPNFIILLGDRYGWRPLPARIEAREFEAIRRRIANNEDGALVDDWYQLDTNAVPSEYLLKPRTGPFKEQHRWGGIEATMRQALREAARAAGLSGEALIKYEASATHREILKGLGKTPEDRAHVFAFFRSPQVPGEDPELTALKRFLRDQLGANVHEPRDRAELCNRVRESLERVILAEVQGFGSHSAAGLERKAHNAFARNRRRHFKGRDPVLKAVAEYVGDTDAGPLVLYGVSGAGKSAAMAQAAALGAAGSRKAITIRRFIGVTPESSDGPTLLRSLCEEIAQRYGDPAENSGRVQPASERVPVQTGVRNRGSPAPPVHRRA